MARRWKLFRFFREETVGEEGEIEDGRDARGSVRRVGVRLVQLLEREGSVRSSAAGWVAVVNGSTKEVEIFGERLKEHAHARLHDMETHAVFVAADGQLWVAGWDGAVGRDRLAQASIKRVSLDKAEALGTAVGQESSLRRTSTLRAEDTFRLGRRPKPTAISVRHGFAAVGFQGGDVAMLFVDGNLAIDDRGRTVNVEPSAVSEGDVLAAEVLAPGVVLAATVNGIFLLRFGPPSGGAKATSEEIDPVGTPSRFAVCYVHGEVAVARSDAISFYTTEGRGRCLAMGAPEAYAAGAGSHLFVLSKNTGARTGMELVAYDIATQLISYRSESKIPIVAVFGTSEQTAVAVKQNGALNRLSLLSVSDRVEHLLQRSLFIAAIQLARQENNPALADRAVHLYARNLASRGEYDAAAEQLAAVATAETDISRVVMLLKEQTGSRSALRRYLEALQSRGISNEKHVRLLVSCYKDNEFMLRKETQKTDRGEVQKLPQSLSALTRRTPTEDAEQIARACRSAGLLDAAEALAREKNLDALLARILVEDRKDAHSLLQLIRDRPIASARIVALVGGRWLLTVEPEGFTDAVVSLGAKLLEDDATETKAVEFFEELGDRIFLDSLHWHAELLQRAIEQIMAKGKQASENLQRSRSSLLSADEAELNRLWERLFEVYVAIDTQGDETEDGKRNDGGNAGCGRAVKLLQAARWRIRRAHAERLADLFGHQACRRLLLEQSHSYGALATQLRLEGDLKGLMAACRRHGERVPSMWLELLRVVARSGGSTPANEQEELATLSEVIDNTLRVGAASELEIMDLLCRTAREKPLAFIRPAFEQLVNRLQSATDHDVVDSAKIVGEIEKMKAESERLRQGPIIVRPGVCEICEVQTTVPAVHFKCGHSFHSRCLVGKECTTCSSEAHGVSEVRKALEGSKDNHDAFFRELERTDYDAVLLYLERSALR